jgi:hypothetical protein
MRLAFHLFLVLFLTITTAQAEPVSVNRGAGLGYVFSHRSNCYLILPAHVHGRQTRLSVSTTAPAAIGDAMLVRSFGPEVDLSLFFVASGLEGRCRDSFADLSPELGTTLDGATTAQLVRVDASGLETRDEMSITAVDFQTLAAVPVATEIYQGTSGAILRVGEEVVGMAIQSEGIDQATFLRMDEIVARLSRLMNGSSPAAPAVTAETPEPAGATCPASTIPVRVVTCSVEPPTPEQACSNLIDPAGGLAAFPAGTSPRITLELDVDTPVPLSSVTLVAPDGGTQWAVPQGIAVEVSSTTGTPRWSRFGNRDMPPTGSVTIGNGARPYASRVAITLRGSWQPELPSALACVAVQ